MKYIILALSIFVAYKGFELDNLWLICLGTFGLGYSLPSRN